MRLDGRIAAVIGGGSGIGEAICHRFASEGATVAALDISIRSAQRTIDAIGAGIAVEADVSNSAAVDQAIAAVERDLGPLDILVNNAGAVGLEHVNRITPLLERQREEMAAGHVETPLDALVRLIVQGIRVNAVAPVFVDTSRLKGALAAGRQAMAARTPAGRLGTPAEIAATVAFLASDDAAYFVGATLSPNGGLVTV